MVLAEKLQSSLHLGLLEQIYTETHGHIKWSSKLGASLGYICPICDTVESMQANMRREVLELMRVCEKLIGFAHQNGELTDEECETVVYYAKELEKQILPFCENHQQTAA